MKQTKKYIAFGIGLTLLSSSIGGASGYLIGSNQPQINNSQTNTLNTLSTNQNQSSSPLSKIIDSVVEINTSSEYKGYFNESYTQEGAGSGVIINKDGYIISNYHVIENASSILVRLTNGNEYKASVVNVDKSNDLALLKIEPKESLTYASLGNSDALSVGEYVLAIGNPLGTLGGSVTEGIISATNRDITVGNQTMSLLQTTAAINSGNSGGGLFNEEGYLIGIVNAKSSGLAIEGLGFAIPIDVVKDFLDTIEYSSSPSEL